MTQMPDSTTTGIPSSTTNQRVIFVIEALTVGGAEQMLVAMANLFHRDGWDAHMVCLTKAGELHSRLDEGVTLHVLDKKPGTDFSLPRKLRRLVKSLDPVAVNCHLWTANTWTRLSLIGSGVRVVATEHSRDTWKGKHYRLIDKLLSNCMHKLVAVSGDTADFYKSEIGVKADRVVVINNGIDTARYRNADGRSIRRELAPNDELLIGTVGRMVTAKNHPRLVEVAAQLRKTVKNFRLVFVGDGPERENLEHAIEKHGVDDLVTLTGARSDVPEILHALDIFVLSSDREGHPLTALEAQSAGTPVVLTNAGGSVDAITGKPVPVGLPVGSVNSIEGGGYLTEKSVDALHEALCELASSSVLRDKMGEFGRRVAESEFDEQNMVADYRKLFIE